MRLIPAHAGKTRGAASDPFCNGLIPAHAGKTNTQRQRTHQNAAHPRSRGENYRTMCMLYPNEGSSPLTRGKRPDHRRAEGARRLIPAHAGKTSGYHPHVSTPPAHPRSRGENTQAFEAAEDTEGSSPLTRGKPSPSTLIQTLLRLIPAHAGKTHGPPRTVC